MVTREQVLGYRAAVHGLSGPAGQVGAVLAVGAQDHPTGATARLALALRGHAAGDGRLVHSVRGATHLHRTADLRLLAGALRIDDGAELAKQSIGQFGAQIGDGFGAALDQVAAAMGDVMSDGQARTKGELSGAVTTRIDAALRPWCAGCGVDHVQDALFRYATLQAGLTIEVESPVASRFRPPARGRGAGKPVAAGAARAELVRRFVHAAGPVRPEQLAAWLALTPAAARRWWGLVQPELRQVEVDGRRAWLLDTDAALFDDPPAPGGVRLLGPYDPLTELADRALLVPEATHRRQVWAPVANPGIVLAGGEIAGTWRRRAVRGRLTLTVAPFRRLPAGWRRAAAPDADVVGEFFDATQVRLELSS